MVKARIYAGIAIIVVFGVVSMLYVYRGLEEVVGHLTRLERIGAPFSIAALEMEKNVGEYAFGVLQYLARPDPEIRAETVNDSDDFARYHASYMRLSRSGREIELGRHLASDFGKLTRIGATLMDRRTASTASSRAWPASCSGSRRSPASPRLDAAGAGAGPEAGAGRAGEPGGAGGEHGVPAFRLRARADAAGDAPGAGEPRRARAGRLGLSPLAVGDGGAAARGRGRGAARSGQEWRRGMARRRGRPAYPCQGIRQAAGTHRRCLRRGGRAAGGEGVDGSAGRGGPNRAAGAGHAALRDSSTCWSRWPSAPRWCWRSSGRCERWRREPGRSVRATSTTASPSGAGMSSMTSPGSSTGWWRGCRKARCPGDCWRTASGGCG